MVLFHNDFEWVIFDNPNVIDLNKVRDCDILLFDVIENNLDYYVNMRKTARTIFRIHNLNFWLNYKNAFSLLSESTKTLKVLKTARVKDLLIIVKTLLPTYLTSKYSVRNKLLNKVDFLTFCDTTQFEYYTNLKQQFRTLQFPSSYYVGHLQAKCANDGTLRIVVPGEVSQKRRDYHIIAEAISKVKSEQLQIDLIILGHGGTKTAKEIFKNIKYCTNNCRLLTFDQFVDQNEYISIMNKSHLLLNPIPSETLYCGIIEKYGFSKTSGAYGDFLRFGLIPVFPSFYPFPTELNSVTEQYDNVDQLVNIIERFTSQNELIIRLNEIERNLKKLNQVSVNILCSSLRKLTNSND